MKYNDKNVVVLIIIAYFLSLEKKRSEKGGTDECIGSQTGTEQFDISRYVCLDILCTGKLYACQDIHRERACQRYDQSSELVDHYGDILFMSGDKEKALEQWKKAKEMGKESDVLDRRIAEGTYIEEEVKNE